MLGARVATHRLCCVCRTLVARRHASGGGGGARRIFEESHKVRQKTRAALSATAHEYDYLRDEVAERVVSRIGDIRRTFDNVLDLGCGSGHVRRAMQTDGAAREAVGTLIEMDAHAGCAGMRAPSLPSRIPLEDASVGLVLSAGWLHWVNDLGGTLREVNRVLHADGAFLATMAAMGTLGELRIALQIAEEEMRGGVSAHVSPFVRPRDVGGALAEARFALATVDSDRLVVRYKDMWALMRHLRAMGEGNAVAARRPHFGRATFERAADVYAQRFSHPLGGVSATFEMVHMIAWKPGKGQQTPLARGAAQLSLADLARAPAMRPVDEKE